MDSKLLHTVTFILIVAGSLNWGLVGLGNFMMADWNVVHMLLGAWMEVEWLVYLLIGISGLWLLISHKKDCRICG